ncbi:hypothetical protein EFA69_13065 [Rufibacter immobilis]|uniref:Uncharacterized protein n=1 Tax=Rufibacter immobilis TaxID=1348778 RepID=A0A3M9MNL3_9BACT|nr:hypothetical protein EFA69_13065 [Rufibacter immobilis]
MTYNYYLFLILVLLFFPLVLFFHRRVHSFQKCLRRVEPVQRRQTVGLRHFWFSILTSLWAVFLRWGRSYVVFYQNIRYSVLLLLMFPAMLPQKAAVRANKPAIEFV